MAMFCVKCRRFFQTDQSRYIVLVILLSLNTLINLSFWTIERWYLLQWLCSKGKWYTGIYQVDTQVGPKHLTCLDMWQTEGREISTLTGGMVDGI